MNTVEFFSIIAPTTLGAFVTWLPTLTGDYIEAQARDVSELLKKARATPELVSEAERLGASLAKGAALMAGATATVAAYPFAAWAVIDEMYQFRMAWISVTMVWGIVALLLFLQTILKFKLHEVYQELVRKPWTPAPGASGFLGFTHATLLTTIVTVCGVLQVVMATTVLIGDIAAQSQPA
ncbi:hypothetical protein QO010_000149 [Caulobacter ginsengisoli]|uniref:YihY/virulence factor BrkB family protein n=1 Tax=Caulobacter ginsengisoli TaxID=400775 RepID=A0ABU0IK64_9CAUL|nr:hypothetical protein [Caulobacter ginsengisoli]MDQ0462401.1 hypothetical protein [Caulobacter ginsengisoli]